MEIELGEYGRTNKGKIFIFAWLENSDGKRYTDKVLLGNGKKFENKFYYFDDGEDIVKHSKNIIDLIEVGDYVNGYYVRKIANYNNELCVFDLNVMQWIPLTEIDVFYSIVTHEQFESIEYKVEEDK